MLLYTVGLGFLFHMEARMLVLTDDMPEGS